MIASIGKEILLAEGFINEEIIETIYIGGGTPSILSADDLNSLFIILRQKFIITPDAEITLEANPDDISPGKLNDWLSLGINRLSVGLQSFNEKELRWMNRAHNAAQSLQCLRDIKNAGFLNYSVDLIYGTPLQTHEDLEKNFEIIANRDVPHISCYALTVEPGTALFNSIKNKRSIPPDDNRQSEQFSLLLEMMEKTGYEQYEISNFAKHGFRSRHNSSYWEGKPYFGFGPAAHSFNGFNKRRWNVANNSLYLQAMEKDLIPFEEEILTDEQRLNEYIMTSLRTAEGVNMERVKNHFGEAEAERIVKYAEKFLQTGKLITNRNGLVLTKEGKFFADGIAAELFS